MTHHKIGEWHFAARPCRNGSLGFLAWCKRGKIVSDGPMSEPGDVWFEFGESADDAIGKLAVQMKVAS